MMDASTLARFRADLFSLAPAIDRLGVAVSGGPDSLAMLLLAHAAMPGRVLAATVDHGLRPEGANEAAAVAAICADRVIPHATLKAEIAPGNLMAEARAARYALLGDWARAEGLAQIAVAHQRDDVAETFLMRAARGSGLGGLARMRPARPLGAGVALIRPLLGWSRAELAAIAAAAGLTAAEDPTNADPRYDRARMRALLTREAMLDPDRLARSAAALADAEAALAWVADRVWAERATVEATHVAVDPADLPRETLRRLAARAVAALTGAPDPPRGLDGLVDALLRGETATLGRVLAAPGPPWRFAPAPPRSA